MGLKDLMLDLGVSRDTANSKKACNRQGQTRLKQSG